MRYMPCCTRRSRAHIRCWGHECLTMRAMLLRVARWGWVGRLVGWVFATMSFALPVERVSETRHWLVFFSSTASVRVAYFVGAKACGSEFDVFAGSRCRFFGRGLGTGAKIGSAVWLRGRGLPCDCEQRRVSRGWAIACAFGVGGSAGNQVTLKAHQRRENLSAGFVCVWVKPCRRKMTRSTIV